MIKSALISLVIMLAALPGFTQNKINGMVTDAQTGSLLKGASVLVTELHISSSTDDEGLFTFKNLPEGKYHICISFIGYRPDTILITLGKKTDKYIECRLQPAVIDISTVTVSASRSNKGDKVPASIDVVTRQNIQQLPVITIDDAFLLVPGLIASRNYGIYNKTGDIIIRGLNRNIQTLVLLDGIPYSLFDGSANIWNKMNVDGVDNVEVLKGPNSSLYGANAMAGVININTSKPLKPLEIKARMFFGTYNTQGGALNARGYKGSENKGFYWGVNGFYRKSGGYIMTPDSIRDSNDVKTYLMEYSSSLKAGYTFGKDHSLEASWQYAYDNRGTGSQFYENEGSFNRYNSHFARLSYNRITKKSEIHVNAFFKKDYYLKQNESVKSSGNYTFYNTHTDTRDGGIWATYSVRLGKFNYLTAGADLKSGATFSDDVYHTSTDTIRNNGKMNFAGVFVQDELSLCKDKLIILGSLRYDWVRFYGGVFQIYSPTVATSFLTDYQSEFTDQNWFAFSPKLGIKYIFNPDYNIYGLYSSGFRPSNVSDISRTGDVSKGFKLANPGLKPERIRSLEIGAGLRPLKWLLLQPCVFYAIGTDFQYFVATGDSVYTSGSNMKPVIKRQNVGRVDIAGIEAKLSLSLRKNISFTTAYTYSHSQIKEYNSDSTTNKDLTGNYLIEVPQHVVAAAFVWNNRIVNLTLTGKYNDKEWIDDENTLQLDAFFTFDAKLQRTFYNKIGVSLTVQNILDKRYLDAKGLMSPGRFILADVTFNW
jgi:outer membrane receptor protein involved in Fe transport